MAAGAANPTATRSSASVPFDGPATSERNRIVAVARVAVACAIGAGVPLAAFDPFNHATDVFHVLDAPWRVLFTPIILICAAALAAALIFPRRDPAPVPRALIWAFGLLVCGGMASIAASADPLSSSLILVLGIVAPAALLIALLNADLPHRWLWAAFLVATVVLMLRADAIFLQEEGLPTASAIFDAKFESNAYDFHYYTLGNPGQTAGFLLLPLGLAAFWATDGRIGWRARVALAGAAVALAGSLVLTYSRSGIAVGVLLLLGALLIAPLPRWARLLSLATVAVSAVALAVASGDYVVELFSDADDASSQERLSSIGEGFQALADDPLTGVGLGQYGPAGGYFSAHSSVAQAGAEMGVLGLAGIVVLTLGALAIAFRALRDFGWGGLKGGAAVALAAYLVYAIVAAPASAGLFSGFISVWGMTVAMLLATLLVPGAAGEVRRDAGGEPLTRRLARLSRTPPRRIVGRLRDEASQEAARVPLARAARGHGRLALDRILPSEATAGTDPVEFGAWPGAIAAVNATPELRRALERRRDEAMGDRHELFGTERVELDSPPDWYLDQTGARWPDTYYRRIAYAQLDQPTDVKYAWELSRLRNCVALAQAYAVLDDELALEKLDRDLRDWIERDPIGHGINWTCAMEVGLRAVNLICVDAILAAAGNSGELRTLLAKSLYQHGWFLARNLEISAINGNHFLADAVGLVWLGRYFGEAGEAPGWSRRGREMVLEATREQVLDDGLDHEGSLPYHLLVLELFLVAYAADREGLADARPALVQMTEAATAFTGPDGRVPNLGDDDGGRALALCDAPSRDARRVLALGGALLGHEGASRMAGDAHIEDALWLAGPDALTGPGDDGDENGPIHLEAGGLIVLGEGADRVVFDVGPVGFRGLGGHGHLDAMSFEAVLGGDVAVRDSGTATYTGDPDLRNWLRDAAAHNVVIVDGRTYAQLGSTLWTIEGDSEPDVIGVDGADGEHTAAARQRLPAADGEAVHTRRLSWRPSSLEIRDEVDAPAGASVAHFLQLPAGARAEGSSRIVRAPFVYELELPADAELELTDVPYSEAYGSTGSAVRASITYRARERPAKLRVTVRRT